MEPSRDVDAIAVDARVVKYNVTLIYADAEVHAAVFVHANIALRHRPLDCHRTLGGIQNATELREYSIARGVYNAAAVTGDHRQYDCLMRL